MGAGGPLSDRGADSGGAGGGGPRQGRRPPPGPTARPCPGPPHPSTGSSRWRLSALSILCLLSIHWCLDIWCPSRHHKHKGTPKSRLWATLRRTEGHNLAVTGCPPPPPDCGAGPPGTSRRRRCSRTWRPSGGSWRTRRPPASPPRPPSRPCPAPRTRTPTPTRHLMDGAPPFFFASYKTPTIPEGVLGSAS